MPDLWSFAEQFELLLEIAAAMALGGIIGYEREASRRPAGFRTHMLVAGASALIVSLGGAMLAHFVERNPDAVSGDPFRLVGAVITALGFIGAGTIFRPQGERVEGLTTAASLLFSGAIGVAAALRLWWLAVGGALLALIVLASFRWIEDRIGAERRPKHSVTN